MEYHDIMVYLMLYGHVPTSSAASTSTNYFGDISYTNHTRFQELGVISTTVFDIVVSCATRDDPVLLKFEG